jgi:hypothetical protein
MHGTVKMRSETMDRKNHIYTAGVRVDSGDISEQIVHFARLIAQTCPPVNPCTIVITDGDPLARCSDETEEQHADRVKATRETWAQLLKDTPQIRVLGIRPSGLATFHRDLSTATKRSIDVKIRRSFPLEMSGSMSSDS